MKKSQEANKTYWKTKMAWLMSFRFISSRSQLVAVAISSSMEVCTSSNSNASIANNLTNSNNRRSSLNKFSLWDRGRFRRTQAVDSSTTISRLCKTYWCKQIALSSNRGRCRAKACLLQLLKLCVNNNKSTLEMPRLLMRTTTYFRIEVVSSHRHDWQDSQANSKMLSNSKWTTCHSQALRTSSHAAHRPLSNISSSPHLV